MIKVPGAFGRRPRGVWLCASAAGVFGVLAACEYSPPQSASPSQPEGTAEISGSPETIDGRDDTIRVSDSTGTDFRAIWGPYSDPECSVSAEATSPATGLTVSATGGDYFVYVTGHFSGISPVSTAPPGVPATALPIWPIIYTTRIKIGASGTSFMLHVNEAKQVYTVIRLREKDASGAWAGGEIEVRADSGAWARIPKSLDTSMAVAFDGVTGVLSDPAALTVDQTALLNEVIRRANLRGVHVPAEAP